MRFQLPLRRMDWLTMSPAESASAALAMHSSLCRSVTAIMGLRCRGIRCALVVRR